MHEQEEEEEQEETAGRDKELEEEDVGSSDDEQEEGEKMRSPLCDEAEEVLREAILAPRMAKRGRGAPG